MAKWATSSWVLTISTVIWAKTPISARLEHHSLAELREHSPRFVAASRRTRALRTEAAPKRQPFPERRSLDLKQPLGRRLIYLRSTTESGYVNLLGSTIYVDEARPHRLVRVEVSLATGLMAFYTLRRWEPNSQPFLRSVPYRFSVR